MPSSLESSPPPRPSGQPDLHAERMSLLAAMTERIAHEIRNPLTSIGFNLSMLRDLLAAWQAADESEARESMELLSSIESQTRRIQQVVDHYLRSAHPAEPQLSPVVLDDLLRSMESELSREARESGSELELSLQAPATAVPLDQEQFRQALLELTRNGLHAIGRGGRVLVATRVAGDRVHCEVTDTGSGVSGRVREEMRRPFFTTRPGHAGLGLTLVEHFVRNHRADWNIGSEPGRGTQVTLSFPTADQAPTDPAHSNHAGNSNGD